MQARDQQQLINMFEWSDGPRLMTVIRGFPMYRSTGNNSGYKNTWFPHLGIDGTRWIRKPRICLPEAVIQFCKQIKLDKQIALNRFGNLQTTCISASIGDGLWITSKGIRLKKYLQKHYAFYFLANDVKEKILALQNTKTLFRTNNITTAHTHLEKYGSIIPVNYRSRLPSDVEYLFFILAGNDKIRTALSMMLLQKCRITISNFTMVCKLSENNNLFEYALRTGMFEVYKNIRLLTERLLKNDKPLELKELIKLNPLHYLLLPFKYKNLQKKFSFRKILRKTPPYFLRDLDFTLMKALDDLHLLDRYSRLITNDEARLGLYFLHRHQEINYKMIRALYTAMKNNDLNKYYEPALEAEYLSGNTYSNSNSLKYSLFSKENRSISFQGVPAGLSQPGFKP